MSIFTKLAQDVFAGFTSAGVARKIEPQDAATWGTEIERVVDIAFTSGSSIIFLTKASIDASLASPAATLAWVVADPIAANNGIYQKSGGPGTGFWTKVADLPYSFIRLTDAGAGTANAIQLTSSLPTSPSVLRVANVFETNTGDVTVSENGAAARSLRTNSGNQIAPGGLVAGGMITYVDDGTNFRLLSDQASEAIVAAAEAAQAAAEAAAAQAIAAASSVQSEQASRASAISGYHPNSAPDFIRTAGYYTAGDGGDALYKKVGSEPPHAGKLSITLSGGGGTVWYEVVYDVFHNVQRFGAKNTGLDADAEINCAAVKGAHDFGKPAWALAGTYKIALVDTIVLEGGTTDCCVPISNDGFALFGMGKDQTIFKLRDNESTDADPKYFNIFSINRHIDGLRFDGFTVDVNGQNNKISPNRGSGTYNPFNTAFLMVSGSAGTVGGSGEDARLTNAKIWNVKVINTPGVTCIGLAQTNTNSGGGGTGATLGENIDIGWCDFYNNGLDANDHSTVYCWANGVRVHHCTFDHPTMSNGVQGPVSPCELHGSENYFEFNEVDNYLWGPYIAGNYTSVAGGQYLRWNKIRTARKSLIFFVELATEPGMDRVHIEDNDFWLTADHVILEQPKRALDIVPSQGNVGRVYSRRNTIRTSDTYGAYGISVGVLAAGKSIGSFVSEDDTFIGFATPIVAMLSGLGTVGRVDIQRPIMQEVGPNTTTPTTTIGAYIGNTQGRVRVCGTRADGVASHPTITVYTDAVTFTELMLEGNLGSASSVISDNCVCNRRFGLQATTFPDIGTLGSRWPSPASGALAWCSSGAELGASPNKYTLAGWRHTGAGWLERRELTGN